MRSAFPPLLRSLSFAPIKNQLTTGAALQKKEKKD
jgi:hypothetical protein